MRHGSWSRSAAGRDRGGLQGSTATSWRRWPPCRFAPGP